MKKKQLSLILPCLNEEEIFEENVNRIITTLDLVNIDYEIIFVDDKSSDRTQELILEYAKKYPQISYLFHEKNYGRGKTVRSGILRSKGEIVGFIDIDLEVDIVYITRVLEEIIINSMDVVYGYRIYNISLRPLFLVRHFLSRGYKKLSRVILNYPILDSESGFKFFNKQKIVPLIEENFSDGWFWDTEIMYKCHHKQLRIKEIPVLFIRNPKKTSKVKIIKDTIEYFNYLLKFKRSL